MEKLKRKFATIFVSLSIMLSAFMSAGSIYIEKSSYLDSSSLYIQVGVFLLLGFVVTVSFWSIEDTVKKHKNWQIPVIFALFLSLFWLFISPKQNAFFFNNREAVVNEIKVQYDIIESTVTPFLDRYESYKKISNELKRLSDEISVMKKEQALTKKGQFWRMLDSIEAEIDPSIRDFTKNYNTKIERTIVNPIKVGLEDISSLEYSEDENNNDNGNKVKYYKSPDLIKTYNSKKLAIQNNIAILKDSNNPRLILETILTKLKGFQNLVNYVKKTANNEHIIKIANNTSKRIDPLVNTFALKVKQANEKSKELEKNLDKIDKITFNTITLNVELVDKHWLKYYPTYLGTQLLDYIPIAFMFFRIVMLIRDRKKLYLIADKEKLEDKYNSEIKKLEKIEECRTKNCKELEENKVLLDTKEKEKRDSLRELENEYDTEVDKLKDSIDTMTIKMRNDIARLEEEEKIKEHEIGDNYSKLQEVRDDFLTLKGNVDRDYNNNKDLINNQIEDRHEDYQRDRERLEDNLNIEIDAIIDKIQEMEERRKVRIANLKEKIDELEEDIKELDEQIKAIEIVDFKIKEDREKQNEE